MKRLTGLLLCLLLLCGCGGKGEEQPFSFTYHGVTVVMDSEAGPVLYRLGRPQSTSHVSVGSHTGRESVYHHGSFSLGTYPEGEREYIRSLWFVDEKVSTREGISIGSSREAVGAAYGAENLDETGCVLTRGNTVLTILLERDRVTAVRYDLITAEEEN